MSNGLEPFQTIQKLLDALLKKKKAYLAEDIFKLDITKRYCIHHLVTVIFCRFCSLLVWLCLCSLMLLLEQARLLFLQSPCEHISGLFSPLEKLEV